MPHSAGGEVVGAVEARFYALQRAGMRPEADPGEVAGEALSDAREGDVLAFWKLDRLGQMVKDLVEGPAAREVEPVRLIDTTTPAGRLFFHTMAALTQMERELIAERTRAGLEAARKRGRVGGRPRKMTPAKVEAARRLMGQGTPARDVAESLGVSVATLYWWGSAKK